MTKNTTANSRFAQLRILFKPVVDFPLENLILVENMRTRSSQLTRSAETLVVSSRNYADIHNLNSYFSSAKRNRIRLRWNFSSRSLKNYSMQNIENCMKSIWKFKTEMTRKIESGKCCVELLNFKKIVTENIKLKMLR